MYEDRVVTVSCRRCGPVALAPVAIRVAAAGGRDDADGLFGFTCPVCARQIWQAADDGTLEVLRGIGAPVLTGPAPFELVEPHRGGTISWDELLDAHELMSRHCCPQDELSA